jgi:hypothetical protein
MVILRWIALFLVVFNASALAALVPQISVLPGSSVEVGEEVYLSATGTTYESANLLGKARYEWDFGDGYTCKFADGVPGTPYYYLMCGGIALTHYFMTPGTYTVTLRTRIWSAYTATNGIVQVASTSSSSVALGTGSKTFTVETGKAFAPEMEGKILVTASTGKYLYGTITSYNSGTGELIMNATKSTSTGTYNGWTVSFDTLPVADASTTTTITVSGTAPLSGFEIQRANYNNRSKQYLYVQIPAAHRNTTTQLKVSLIKDASATTVLLAPKNHLAAEEVLLFDQSALTAGDYVVQAQLLDASGNQITGGLWRDKFNRNYAGVAKVAIDENNSFKVNGTYFFPVGPFQIGASSFPSYIASGGINMLNTEGYAVSHTPSSYAQYLTDASGSSLVVVGPGRGDYTIDFSPSAANSWKRNHNPDRMADYITAGKDKASVFGWMWQDEVNLGGYAEKQYLPIVAAWAYKGRSLDQQHPSYEGFVGSDWSKYYGTAITIFDYLGSDVFFGGKKWIQDWIGFDTYPVTQQLYTIQNYTGVTGGTYAVAFDSIDRLMANNKNLVPFTPFQQPCAGLTPIVATNDQVYMEAWLNVIHGAKGIFWFNYFYMDTTGRWTAMKKFTNQITALKDVVLGPPTSRGVTDTANPVNVHDPSYNQNRVDTMIREDANYIYVIAARMTEPPPANSYVSVTLSGTPGTVITNGRITDAGHTYEWTLPSSVTIGAAGTVSAIATCATPGYIAATPATLTTIVTPVTGWSSVTHTQSATPGSRFQGIEPDTLSGVQFTVSGLTGTLSAEVYDESRNISVVSGVFSDDFAKNAVHIYKIAKSGSPVYYSVSVTKSGTGSGTVTSSPSGINCGADCSENLMAGNTITLSASPAADSTFAGWSGSGCAGTGTCIISSISADSPVTATFTLKPAPPYRLMIISYTGNGSGSTNPVPGQWSEQVGTEIVIGASANTNSMFSSWGGTCGCSGTSTTCTIAAFPSADCTVTAEFAQNAEFTVSVTVGAGADYVTSDSGGTCSRLQTPPCIFRNFVGGTIGLSVMPLRDYYSCQWTGCTQSNCTASGAAEVSVLCPPYPYQTVTVGGTRSIAIGGTKTLTFY